MLAIIGPCTYPVAAPADARGASPDTTPPHVKLLAVGTEVCPSAMQLQIAQCHLFNVRVNRRAAHAKPRVRIHARKSAVPPRAQANDPLVAH